MLLHNVTADALPPLFSPPPPPSYSSSDLLLLFHSTALPSPSPPPAGSPPSTELPEGPYPFMVTSVDGRQVPVVQAYAFGKYLGYLKVTFNSDGEVVKVSGNPILLDSSVPQGEPARS